MTGHQYIPCLPYILASHAAALDVIGRQPPAAHGSPFPIVTIREPDGTTSKHLEITWTATTGNDWVFTEDPDESPLKARQRRFREFVASTRRPEPEWLPPRFVKPGKRTVVRWGARSREQRERRKP